MFNFKEMSEGKKKMLKRAAIVTGIVAGTLVVQRYLQTRSTNLLEVPKVDCLPTEAIEEVVTETIPEVVESVVE